MYSKLELELSFENTSSGHLLSEQCLPPQMFDQDTWLTRPTDVYVLYSRIKFITLHLGDKKCLTFTLRFHQAIKQTQTFAVFESKTVLAQQLETTVT